jgi:hypothetical protein
MEPKVHHRVNNSSFKEQNDVSVTLHICIREVLGSNLGRYTEDFEIFHGFPLFLVKFPGPYLN